MIFFSSFLSLSWRIGHPNSSFESSSALAFFTLFSFSSCFLLVGIQSPHYAFGGFSLASFRLKNIPVSLDQPIRFSNE